MGLPPTIQGRALEAYRGESGRQYHEGKRALLPVALPWIIDLRAEKFASHVRPADVVFEYGAGSGWNLSGLKCARKCGYDAADFLREKIIASGIEFIENPAAIPPASVDVVLLHHVLEHLLSPAECLCDMGRILKPRGKLIIHVPWERERRYATWNASEPNHHLYTWNVQTLGNLVRACGYEIEAARTRRYGYDRFAANLAGKLRLGRRGFRLLRSTLLLLKPLLEVELLARLRPVGNAETWENV